MRRLALLAFGLAVGLTAGLALTGACSVCSTTPPPEAGTYRIESDGGESDHELVFASNRRSATERFTRGGVTYEIVYGFR